jgi:chromate reductase, NAD(P)H dehydrogenase (quinone)
MVSKKNILAICGSTRKNSVNKGIINVISELATNTLTITVYNELLSLPYFNQDDSLDNTPQPVLDFRAAIEQADGILICTPEYVFSLPGILKNALEWTVSTTLFADKPTALITASSSGDKAHESLILIMNTLGIKTTQEMCLLISGVKSKINHQGKITDADLEQKLMVLSQSLSHL